MDIKCLAWVHLTGRESDALHSAISVHRPDDTETDPLIPQEERPDDDDDDDDGNTSQPFQPGSSSTPGPSGEEYPMSTSTTNRLPESGYI